MRKLSPTTEVLLPVTLHPVERFRLHHGLNQRALADLIFASADLVSRCERGQAIQRKYALRLIAVSKGALSLKDFKLQPPTRNRRKRDDD